MTHVAVVLAGCGYLDGTEIREAVFTLLALDEADATVQCFAPDTEQMHVVDHVRGEPVDGETRNVLFESARIARGDVRPLTEFSAADFDALVFPGGFGGAKNLSDFALKGTQATVREDVRAAVDAMQAMQKPIGFICITPASVGATLLGSKGPRLAVGAADDPAAGAVDALGATHVACPVAEAVVDEAHRVVSTPAYMDGAARPKDVYAGIRALVHEVLAMARTLPAPTS